MLASGLILPSLLPFKLRWVTAFPTPVLNWGFLPSGDASPNPTQELGLASPRRGLLHGSGHTQRGRGASGLGDTEDTSASVPSILGIHWGTRVVFQLSKFS